MDNERSTIPMWYHLALGLTAGAALVAWLLASGTTLAMVILTTIIANVTLNYSVRRWMPRPPSKAKQPGTALVVLAMVIVMVAIIWIGWSLAKVQGMTWVGWVAGLAVFGLAAGGGWATERLR